ncbi:MAG: acetyl-CoA acetyltransferase [Acidimicrobiia bacterium]
MTTPVIVGVGQYTHRDDNDLAGAEPIALIEAAARAAGDDSAPDLLRKLDVVELMGLGSWFYDDLPGLVGQRLGADVPASRRRMLPTGGETPLRALDLAAARIADRQAKVVLLAGAESTRALTRAKKAGAEVPWTAPSQPRPPWDLGAEFAGAQALGLERAFDTFPLYEHALRAVEGKSLADAQRESAELWAGLSRVAAANPYAWSREEHTADELATVSDDNRMVSFPYTKRLVANPFVNQGAALLLTDTDTARAHGIPEDQWVYPWGGAGADEPTDPRARDHYAHNRALEAAVQITQAITRTSLADYDAVELYSCFPIMPKLTARVLGLREGNVSVTGGLSFAGGPGSNYLTHSLAQMVRRLRESGGTGFVHGVGMFNTKHHCVVLSARPSPRGEYPEVPHDPAEPRPPLYDPLPVDDAYEGPLTIETLSVRFGRDGAPTQGVVLGRGSDGQRVGARLRDADTMAALTDAVGEGVGEPVGVTGTAVAGRPPEFRL